MDAAQLGALLARPGHDMERLDARFNDGSRAGVVCEAAFFVQDGDGGRTVPFEDLNTGRARGLRWS